MSGQSELFKKLYGTPVSIVSQQDLYDELAEAVPPEDYTAALKKLADEAAAKTVNERRLKEKAGAVYVKATNHHSLCWRSAWMQARREMITEEQQ